MAQVEPCSDAMTTFDKKYISFIHILYSDGIRIYISYKLLHILGYTDFMVRINVDP